MLAIRIVAISVIIGGLAWLVRRESAGSIARAVSRVTVWPILVAAAINFGIILCKAIAWRLLLAPAYGVPVSRLFRYTLVSCAASVILPLRAGELVRLWMLRDRDGVPLSRGASVAVAEKLLDVISMLILVAPVPLLVPDLPRSVGLWISGIAVGIIVLIAVLRGLLPRLGTAGWRGQLADGLAVLREPRKACAAVAVLLVSWLIDLAMIELVLWAVGIDLPPGAGLVVLLAINVTIAVPSTPGQIGALELGAMLGLRAIGVHEAESLTFAVLYHVLQVVPIVLAGLAAGAPELWRQRAVEPAKDSEGGGN